jgi:predicted ribosome quality control (RQC) complex YloA/Tae2 family protein
MQAGGKAVKAAAARTEAALAAASSAARIQQLRKVHWFEKFLWFVSTEGYLVIAGRDAQQNELLVRRCAAIATPARGNTCSLLHPLPRGPPATLAC